MEKINRECTHDLACLEAKCGCSGRTTGDEMRTGQVAGVRVHPRPQAPAAAAATHSHRFRSQLHCVPLRVIELSDRNCAAFLQSSSRESKRIGFAEVVLPHLSISRNMRFQLPPASLSSPPRYACRLCNYFLVRDTRRAAHLLLFMVSPSYINIHF